MTRAVLWVVPAATAVVAAAAGAGAAGVLLAALLGLVVGAGLFSHQAGRVRAFARRVNRWVGDDSQVVLDVAGGSQWRELGTAVNALGTQLRSTREELRSLVPWAERLVSSLEEPAFVFDPDGRLAAANGPALEFASLPEDTERVTALGALGSAALADAVTEAAVSGRIVAVTESRGARDLRATASPLDEHVLVVVSDRTRERLVEEVRRNFVVNASHELKTPVTSIRMLVEALAVAPEERRAGLVSRLDEESDRLMRLVHDLLDLRMLEEDDELARTPVDLVALVREAVAASRDAADRREVTFALELPDAAVVVGERRQLALVVSNLVSNAVQYNRDGGRVTVALERDAGSVVLTVRDTGVGIPATALERIFERFYRVDVARSRARGGTGLGLSIVRHAVERHGGRVTVESLLGDGTTFTVRLPVEPPA